LEFHAVAKKHSPDVQRRIADLPNAEMEVLAFIRRRGSATIREISEGMDRAMGISASQALLLRLQAKGMLERKRLKSGEPYRFIPTSAADSLFPKLTRRIINRIFGGNPVDVVSALLEGREPTETEIKQLKQILADAQKRKKS
jgi:BlaI family transcriptional regulator, penicillinase repressor